MSCLGQQSSAGFACGFSPVLPWVREGGTGASALCSDRFATTSESPIETPGAAARFSLTQFITDLQNFICNLIFNSIFNSLTRHAEVVLVWWDVINRCVGLQHFLLRHTLLPRNPFLCTERACPSALCSSFWSSLCDSDNGLSSP